MKIRSIKPQVKHAGGFTIKAWERGVLLRFGKSEGLLNPGLHFKFPGIDEIKVVDIRPQDHTTEFTIITNDRYNLEASTNARYKVYEPELAVVNAPENFGEYIDKVMETQGSTEVCKNMTMQQALERRDLVAQSIESFLQEQVIGWGINIEKILLNELTPPTIIPEATEAIYRSQVEAEIYRKIKVPELEVLSKLKQELGDDVIYGLLSFFSSKVGDDNPMSKYIRRLIEARSKGDAARVLAERINSSPQLTYLVENVRGVVENTFGNIKKASDIKEVDEILNKRLYPKK